jgi:predicted RNase H-like HicB family nuclease
MNDYHINIYYSEQDHGYIADVPDLSLYSTPCKTAAGALANIQEAKERWLAEAAAEQRPIPEPTYHSDTYVPGRGVDSHPPDAKPLSADQPSYEFNINYIKERIAARQCILFLGSAIHVPPPPELPQYKYPAEKSPPIGSQLAKILAKKCNYPGADWWNLQRVAQYFEKEVTFRSILVDEIKQAVDVGREPSPILRMLADLEFPIVITTNYDHLYEQALEQKAKAENIAKPFDVSIYNPNVNRKAETVDCPRVPDPKRPYLLKIHGDISEPESIVLTDEDYIQFVLRMSEKHPFHPFGNNVLAHLIKWPTLFVGYSLTDYNLRLLFKTLRWKLDAARIPPNYSVDKKPDDLIRDVWEKQRRYVSFIVLNLWDCIPKLHPAPERYYSRDNDSPSSHTPS